MLTPEHLAQLVTARDLSKKVRRAIAVATFDGYAIGAFAVVTLLTGLTDSSALLLGIVMAVVAFVEIRAGNQLRRLELLAPRTLAINQLALAAVLILYAVSRLIASRSAPSAYADYIAADPELGKMLVPIDDLTRQMTVYFYAGLIAIAVVAQGGMALYYYTRPRYLRAYLAQTPTWIIEMQRAGIRL
ncbi:hypothetical protein [Humisphaera borealis]|uniref:Uncharacterized protein n=1 Tax=Humisphaera borealis TaxID=2807512 RepID=A0A7M2X330_9BACT|nr:hypothetical protein [Humisphaera borealis]QOV91170.1 hypothetical protein IPV69_07370 [Humisphaera borealis]